MTRSSDASLTPFLFPPGLPMPQTSGPTLCVGDCLTPEQGQAALEFTLSQCPTLAAWQFRADHNRRAILRGAGLDPLPRRTPLNPIIRHKRSHDDYTIENVAFESIPGFYATGNLYRPRRPVGRCPAILCTHGHWPSDDVNRHPRFLEMMQYRCASLARMGAVALSIDMFGWGDSTSQVPHPAHQTPLAMPMQIWNGIRAIDFLISLDDVDPARIAVTGESGGGTQTFLIAALDPRISVSIPVVMVSSYFFGGCPCESGRPIHRSENHFITNAEIAALAAPRPMLVVSVGTDWTQHTPQIEFPFLRRIYALHGAEQNVVNVHLPTEQHDYGPSKRHATYRFLAEHFKLDLTAVEDAAGKLDESHVTIEEASAMRVWTDANPLPPKALKSVSTIEAALKAAQRGGHIALRPRGQKFGNDR